jgi:hypothetical protein
MDDIFLPHRLNISSTWTKYSFWWMNYFLHVNETYSTLQVKKGQEVNTSFGYFQM